MFYIILALLITVLYHVSSCKQQNHVKVALQTIALLALQIIFLSCTCLQMPTPEGFILMLLLTEHFLALDQRQDYYQTLAATYGNLKVPHPSMSLYKSSLAYKGSILWNSLPVTIRGSSSILSFKHYGEKLSYI